MAQRVVLKGIKDGERVVVSGLQRVHPGIEVVPKMSATAQTQPAGPQAANARDRPCCYQQCDRTAQ